MFLIATIFYIALIFIVAKLLKEGEELFQRLKRPPKAFVFKSGKLSGRAKLNVTKTHYSLLYNDGSYLKLANSQVKEAISLGVLEVVE